MRATKSVSISTVTVLADITQIFLKVKRYQARAETFVVVEVNVIVNFDEMLSGPVFLLETQI